MKLFPVYLHKWNRANISLHSYVVFMDYFLQQYTKIRFVHHSTPQYTTVHHSTPQYTTAHETAN